MMSGFFEKLSIFTPFVKVEKENNLVENLEDLNEDMNRTNSESDKEKKQKKSASDSKKKNKNERADTTSDENNKSDTSKGTNKKRRVIDDEESQNDEVEENKSEKSDKSDTSDKTKNSQRLDTSEKPERRISSRTKNKSKKDKIILYEYIFHVDCDTEGYDKILLNGYLKNTLLKMALVEDCEYYAFVSDIQDSMNTRSTRNSNKKKRNRLHMNTEEFMQIDNIGTHEAYILDNVLKVLRQTSEENESTPNDTNDNLVSEEYVQIADVYEVKKIHNSLKVFNEVFQQIEQIINEDNSMKDFIVIKFVKSKKKNKMKNEIS